MNDYQYYIHQSRYARYLDDKKRRESWEETVTRYTNFFAEKFPKHKDVLEKDIKKAILGMEIVGSMRALMTAGPALERDNVAGYNCSYIPIDHPRAFSEVMHILMSGTGVGFSVERQYVNQLPTIAEELYDTDTVIIVKDSKLGWVTGFGELISLLYSGRVPKWDLSKLRPAGARLKTFGGRSSGPGPLDDLFKFCIQTFRKAAGRKLTSLEVHDIVCKTGEVVVVGGVRRSALISLSNLSDDRMRGSKMGQWWEDNVQRALSNNSAAYTEKPDIGIFIREWLSLYESKSGERGIFNRIAATKQAKKTGRRDVEGYEYGTNPCGEIILRPNEFCNLTEVIIRPDDELSDLKRKVKLATILGTFQSTLTDFKYLRNTWKKNCEEERLLGVSLTGIMDHEVMSGQKGKEELVKWLEKLKDIAIETNKEYAKLLGINPSASITCIKPSGTVSQLVDSSSGIHPRFAQYYIRTVRNDVKDPICNFLISQGVPHEPDVTNPNSVMVFSFPIKSPDHAVFSMTAIEQLEIYKVYRTYWCEHNPSITVYLKDSEWLEVGHWVYKYWDDIGGVSFLPHTDHVYKQAPYQPITKDEYDKLTGNLKQIDWSEFKEEDDNTVGSQNFACESGVCELKY